MVSLNLKRINSNSPYAVTALRDSMCFRFVTDFGVIYYVSFLEDELMLSDESYQFIIANTNNRKSPRDSKLRRAIMAIVYEFSNVLIQLCCIFVRQEIASRVCAIAFLSFGFIPRRVNLISLSCLRTSEMRMGYRIMRRLLFDSIIPI